jgi:hypothetical protein
VRGNRAQRLWLDRELRHVPRVDGDRTVGPPGTTDHSQRRFERVDVDVERDDLIGDQRLVVLRRVVAELGEALGDLLERARGAGDVADLDVVGPEHRRRVPQQPAALIRGPAAFVVGIEEPVHQELELEPREAVVVEDLADLAQRPRFELMLEVGMPNADPGEADALRLRAAVAEIEQAPFAALMHLDRSRSRPVEPDQLDVLHLPLPSAIAVPCAA